MVKLSALTPIKTPHQFFQTDKILLIDFLRISKPINPAVKRALAGYPNVFKVGGDLYLIIILRGSPENLFLRAKQGMPIGLYKGAPIGVYFWDGDLARTIREQRVFDYTRHYKKGNPAELMQFDIDFIMAKYARGEQPGAKIFRCSVAV